LEEESRRQYHAGRDDLVRGLALPAGVLGLVDGCVHARDAHARADAHTRSGGEEGLLGGGGPGPAPVPAPSSPTARRPESPGACPGPGPGLFPHSTETLIWLVLPTTR